MKVVKRIIGIISVALVVVLVALYFVTKATPTSEIAVKLFYPENVTNINNQVFGAMCISLAATFVSGLLSIILAKKRKGEIAMIILDAIGFLAGLMYSLLVPCLLYVAVLDIIALAFSVSYSMIENDFNGKI